MTLVWEACMRTAARINKRLGKCFRWEVSDCEIRGSELRPTYISVAWLRTWSVRTGG